MGSNLNIKNCGNEPPGESGSGGAGVPLARQSSVYSLTFDEFLRGSGKDFGSMNMDELLKNIWSAEESQNMGTSGVGGQEASVPGGNLQRQGSLTLPRTLSQKTVDEVWKDMSKEYYGGKDGNGDVGLSNMPRRQQTLGEMTLEDFLVRAGVVREDAQLVAKASNVGVFGDMSHAGNSLRVGFGYQQSNGNTAMVASRNMDNNSGIGVHSGKLPLNVNEIISVQQQQGTMQLQQQPQQQQQQQPLFPKQPGLAYGAPMAIPTSGQLGSPGMRGGIVGISDPALGSSLVQSAALTGGGMNMVGFGAGGVTGATGSPAVSSDGLGKSNGDTSSISPVPYVFSGGLRGRKGGAVEKVVERRQRRMIKNRESAARSRARKQAYTMELEAEVAKLKEENEELRKKQAEMMEMQKNQVQEMMNLQRGAKR
ncbi:PREDICTED: ABSCISIC ACID-INSENSITIVE 5-like protein 5 [Nicotiana attenuata]|uniref:Abscisic acid-insensitive 5-like protein 5 n=1 Tax=Nicotiana attenuata TaxID=49451 RepID=A0A314KHG6_NICAT|nr:PREDICTED: ABSCISIC ACID-INSENSITIVE 5-like protein 5 [Nicotiana attenuata]OIT28775.1 abscisic acid-insensitive 5-like protein 5 [Nicotiana attenuata]